MRYARYQVDIDATFKRLDDSPITLRHWQGDDVAGFEQKQAAAGS